jgi:outer membrane protein OmpA-like peptidoglycan-associated protein
MSLCQNTSKSRVVLACLLFFTSCGVLTQAQDENPPKADLFLGYQWLNPGGNAPSFAPGAASGPVQPARLPSFVQGFGAAVGYNFHPNIALEGDLGASYHSPGMSIYTVSTGPRFTWRSEGVNLFAHALVGLNRLELQNFGTHNQIGAIVGGGIDLAITHAVSLRLIEADYQVAQPNFSKQVSPVLDNLRHPTLNGTRLRTGLVFNFGGAPITPVAASCSAQPQEVMVGEPVTLTANASNFNPKHTLTYTWSSTGGKIAGKDNTATVDTTGIAGGSYTATARVSDPKAKKNGEASCNANFTVKEPPKNPPTMSCTASPTSLQAGATATVTCECKSPDNVPVNVAAWTASAGSVSGTGNTGTLNTTGAPAGPVTVSATCTDSRGLTASSNAQVNVEQPPPPPPQSSKLSECAFPNKAKPWRVDNTCKAVLDDVAQALKNQADAKVVIVGFADPDELKKRKNLAGERAVDAKAYLSGGEAKQAIDPSRLEVRTGSGGGQKTEFWLVPAGANFTEADTQPVDEGKVKPIPDHPRPAPKKKAKAQ